MKCLITEPIHQDGIDLLRKHCSVDIKYNTKRKELLECVDDYEIMIIRSDTPIDKELLDVAKNLKAIGMGGIGLNHIDTEYAKSKGIAVFNVRDGSNDSVAELTVGLIINIARKINLGVRDVKDGIWEKTNYIGNQLKGKTLGLIAMGKIGSKVARICQSMEMEILAYDPYLDPEIAAKLGIEILPLEDVLKKADIVSIHAPLTKETYHMIGENELSIMKNDAYLINMGRGGIVDEDALYAALSERRLAGSAVDVMEKEPPGESRLLTLDNFICTPHIGAGTIESQQYIGVSIARQVLEHMDLMDSQ